MYLTILIGILTGFWFPRCAMGLLHSRVKRVFYSKQNAVSGALESCYKIHLYHKLNHHFEAFKVTM